MKARRSEFKTMYEFYENYKKLGFVFVTYPDKLVTISHVLDNLGVEPCFHMPSDKLPGRLAGKILTMQKWLKSAEILVIKDNNRPLLFLKYGQA